MAAAGVDAFLRPFLDEPGLVRITLSGGTTDVRKAVLRPVELGGVRKLQLMRFDAKRSTTANLDDGADALVAETIALPFRHVTVELAGKIIEGRMTKKGKLVTHTTVRAEPRPADLAHDRTKAHPIAEDAPFLEALGVAAAGRVKPSRQAKYRQINHFVRLLESAPGLGELLAAGGVVRVADLGCGNAYLSFAVHHHLTANAGVECDVVGVDRNPELVARNEQRARALGARGLRFVEGDIASFGPDAAEGLPHVVIALHACDTASDHAIAAFVRWRSSLGMFAPCCHHHVQAQLSKHRLAPSERVLVGHGILLERVGDALTDAARAAVLRLLGYDVDVVEFVSPEHTPKNILIRASWRDLPTPPELVDAYSGLLERWGVVPLLDELLRPELAARGA